MTGPGRPIFRRVKARRIVSTTPLALSTCSMNFVTDA